MAASLTALAPGFTQQAHADESADTSKYVTAWSNRAAEPAPEILGLSNVSTNTAFASLGKQDWSSPYFYIFGDSTYNTSANPYMINSVLNYKSGTSNYSPSMVVYSAQTSPASSLKSYSSDSEAKSVWDLKPDVILGNSDNVNYNTNEYAYGTGDSNYKTYGAGDSEGTGDYGVAYDCANCYTMIGSMYNLATAANNAATATGKTTRYGSTTAIAADFERYVKGTQGYILKKLNSENKAKKTVCNIASYDKSTDTYNLVKTGDKDGTASENRYLEAVQNVSTNIADSKTVAEGATYVTATRAEVEACDLIMVGGQRQLMEGSEEIITSLSSDAQDKAYWVSSASISAGSCYGVVMNSVENAQNIGRILGCLYPEYVDQSDWIAYYYENFYHLKSDKLAEAIDNAMDGVRNYNAKGSSNTATTWEKSDVSDYKESTVISKLNAGIKYIQSLGSNAGLLELTDNYADASKDLDGTTEADSINVPTAVSGLKYTGKAQTGVKAEAGYTVSNGSATAAGTYKATVSLVDGYMWSDGSTTAKTVEFSIAKASQTPKVKTTTKTVKKSKVKKKAQKVTAAIKVTGAQGKVTYAKKSGSAKLKIASNGKITVKKKTKKGTYKIKVVVKAAGNANYNAATKTVTVKVKVK
ncbi:MAG: hypothetical protein Q4A43_03815 [Coriobacteriia bacterium]|nr:hypothetical protein [Coriobacteriia bacterium]